MRDYPHPDKELADIAEEVFSNVRGQVSGPNLARAFIVALAIKEAKSNSNLYLEMPKHGGHVGFYQRDNVYYNERRALEFVNSLS